MAPAHQGVTLVLPSPATLSVLSCSPHVGARCSTPAAGGWCRCRSTTGPAPRMRTGGRCCGACWRRCGRSPYHGAPIGAGPQSRSRRRAALAWSHRRWGAHQSNRRQAGSPGRLKGLLKVFPPASPLWNMLMRLPSGDPSCSRLPLPRHSIQIARYPSSCCNDHVTLRSPSRGGPCLPPCPSTLVSYSSCVCNCSTVACGGTDGKFYS